MTKIIKKIKEKHILKRYIIFSIAMFIGAINFNLLIKPSRIVAGGVNGLAILFNDIFDIPPSSFIFAFSLLIMITSIFLLGISKASSILLFTIIYPFFVKTTAPITNILSVNTNDLLLCSIFIGIITGIVNGICYKIELGAGPIPLISQIINKFTNLSLGKISFFINAVIIITSAYQYGIEKVIYATLIIYINSLVIDKVLLGISSSRILYILTNNYNKLQNYINNELKMPCSTFLIEDIKSHQQNQIVLINIKNKDYYKLIKKIKEVDKSISVVAIKSYETSKKTLQWYI